MTSSIHQTLYSRFHAAVMLAGLVSVVASGCQKSEQAPAPATVASAPVADKASAHSPAAAGGALTPGERHSTQSPAEMYADCKDRVEGEDKPGECQSDADCQKAGCSKELCISTEQAEQGVMSTCEVRPCFQALSACGCDAGVCSWSVEG